MSQRLHQDELPFGGRGGPRKGAGRPNNSGESVPHSARPRHSARHPVHVNWHLREGLPRLRNRTTYRAILGAFQAAKDRPGLRVNHFSVMSDHLHVIVEADDRRSLSRGLQGLAIRVAKALNRIWRRRGSVFFERFHEHILKTPCEVRHALAYVLNNARRHGIRLPWGGSDPFSSAPWFDGWKVIRSFTAEVVPPVSGARSWLLTEGWRRHGLVDPNEIPGGRTQSRVSGVSHRVPSTAAT